MTAGDRFKSWIEGLSAAWKDRLAGWSIDIASRGIERMLDDMEPEVLTQVKEHLDVMRNLPDLPPETKRLLDSMTQPKSFAFAVPLLMFFVGIITQLVAMMFKGALEPARQAAEKATPFHIPDVGVVLDMKLRQKMEAPEFYDLVSKSGWSSEWADRFMDMKHPVLPSDLALPAWLRDKTKYQHFVNDLPKLGLTPEQIELLTEMAYRIPGVQDIIRYVVKEAYNPAIYKAFGQDQEYPSIAEADAEKTGVRPDQLMKEWIAHWDLPSVGQGFEMLHRGLITDDQLTLLLKAKDIMPFWRDKLTDISWSLPGRIEVRMMAQLGLVDKAFIIDILRKDGLAEEYLDVVADMNIVRGIRADIQTRYTKGWLNSDEVRSELNASGLSPQVADRLYQWIVKNAGPARTAKELDLTKAEIVKGVKTGIIEWNDGIERLVAMGYDADEAAFIMAINIEVVVPEPTSTITVQTDTIRRQRRQRLISKEDEITMLITIGLDPALAQAYADNDDLRLVKETTT